MTDIPYSVLIRTYNSEKSLPATLSILENQTIRPSKYIIVDSGSTDRTLSLLPQGAVIHNFVGPEFNYSGALNQGLRYVSTNYVMIISSHTLLRDRNAIAYALDVLASNQNIGAAYFCSDNVGGLRYNLVDRSNFNGFNGLWNTCCIIKVGLLRRRRFRCEVFIAEDQEWAKWLFYCEKKAVARISGAGMDNISNNQNWQKGHIEKRLNEYVAIAYYVRRDLLSVLNLAGILLRVFKPPLFLALSERSFYVLLLLRLIACRFSKPKYKSRYF